MVGLSHVFLNASPLPPSQCDQGARTVHYFENKCIKFKVIRHPPLILDVFFGTARIGTM